MENWANLKLLGYISDYEGCDISVFLVRISLLFLTSDILCLVCSKQCRKSENLNFQTSDILSCKNRLIRTRIVLLSRAN